MHEVKVKTHLIVTDTHSEYHMNWCGKILDSKPLLNDIGLPTFIVVGSKGRVEVNTVDMNYLEDCAKRLTNPRGRSAISYDSAHIYIKEINGAEKLMGVLFHRRVRTFAPMHDRVYWE